MPDAIELQTRQEKGTAAVKRLRGKAQVPGVIYGDNIKSREFSIAMNKISMLAGSKGKSLLFDVKLGDEEPVKAIVQDIQKDPVSDQPKHIDLYQVRMDKTLNTEIALEFTGESDAVKDLGGTLVKHISELPIECLPADLVHEIIVPIGSLKTFEDVIRVSDLELPKGVETHLDENLMVANVMPPRSEEELEELEAEVKADVEDIEVTGEKPAEEGEEGESEEGEEKSSDEEKSAQGGSASGGKE